jgi:lactoylglutathione lyase
MKIEHIAIWVCDLEQVRDFYIKYFGMKCSKKYFNSKKNFSSYFLSFEQESTRIEIMNNSGMTEFKEKNSSIFGLAHFSISVGGKQKVNELTEILRNDGFKVIGEPRTTGDGYYESIVEDCEGNLIELTE